MKKTILAVAVILCVKLLSAQTYQNRPEYGWRFKNLRVDSTFNLPLDTVFRSNINLPGALVYQISDNSLYTWNGAWWNKIVSGGSIIALDSAAYNAATGAFTFRRTTGGPVIVPTGLVDSLQTRWIKRVVDSIPQLYSLNGTYGDVAFVKDTVRGGIFSWSNATTASDSGIVIPALTGRWIRLMQKPNEVQADWWADNVNSPAVRKAITYLSTRGGGVVKLGNRAYKPAGWDINNRMSYDNISVVGVRLPYYNSDCTGLQGGSIIQGPFVVGANNFSISNVGIDMGLNVSNTYGIEGDGFGLAAPNLASYNPWKNVRIDGLITLCKSPTSLFHSTLIEGVEGGYVNNVTACYGVHGIVIKGIDVQAGNLRSYANGWNGLVLKADVYAYFNKVQVASFIYDSIPTLTAPYTNARCQSGINLFSNFIMGSATIDKATVFHAEVGLKSSGDSSLGNLYIGSLLIDFTDRGSYINSTIIKRVQLTNVNISNSRVGMYFKGGKALYPVNIGSLYVSNQSFSGDTALSALDSTRIMVGNFRAEKYNTQSYVSGNAKLYIASDTAAGMWSPDDYSLLTSAQKRLTITAGGNIGIGNTSPSYKLDVSGNIRLQDKIFTGNQAADIAINMQSSGLTIPNIQGTNFADNASKNISLQYFGGNVGIGNQSPTSLIDISSANGFGQLRLRTSYTPSSTSDANGNTGDVSWDANYLYIKTAAGWKRAALSTF